MRTVFTNLNLVLLGAILLMTIWLMHGCTMAGPPSEKLSKGCKPPEVLRYTPEDWSDMDQMAYDAAGKTCARKIPDRPCMLKFIRYEQRRYRAICGGVESDTYELDVRQR